MQHLENTSLAFHFKMGSIPLNPTPTWIYDQRPFHKTIEQLKAYFSGKRKTFTMKAAPAGTPFQQQVWQALKTIPYGKTVSYGDIAQAIGKPQASRAVGAANGEKSNLDYFPLPSSDWK